MLLVTMTWFKGKRQPSKCIFEGKVDKKCLLSKKKLNLTENFLQFCVCIFVCLIDYTI